MCQQHSTPYPSLCHWVCPVSWGHQCCLWLHLNSVLGSIQRLSIGAANSLDLGMPWLLWPDVCYVMIDTSLLASPQSWHHLIWACSPWISEHWLVYRASRSSMHDAPFPSMMSQSTQAAQIATLKARQVYNLLSWYHCRDWHHSHISNVTNYCSVAGLGMSLLLIGIDIWPTPASPKIPVIVGLYCYDFTLTFDQQVQLFQARKLSVSTTLFALLHITGVLYILLPILSRSGLSCEVSHTAYWLSPLSNLCYLLCIVRG